MEEGIGGTCAEDARDVSEAFPSAFADAGLVVFRSGAAAPSPSSSPAPPAGAAATSTPPCTQGAPADDDDDDDDACAEAELVAFHLPPGSVGVQIGEAAQILSGGALASTPHGVRRPRCADDAASPPTAPSPSRVTLDPDAISRQMFVVFCQPGWDARMVPPAAGGCWADEAGSAFGGCGEGGATRAEPAAGGTGAAPALPLPPASAAAIAAVLAPSAAATASFGGIVPPLGERWERGATFAAFSRATTAAYFGARGAQTRTRG
jgi:hypothetical protein